jgi:hypothetical protein
MEGIGDVIAAATKAIGIEPCESCEKRRDKLNKLFPFKKPHQLTKEEFDFLASVFQWYNGLPILSDQVPDLLKCEQIWLKVFKVKTGACKSCGSHYQNAYMKDLKKLYENSLHIS